MRVVGQAGFEVAIDLVEEFAHDGDDGFVRLRFQRGFAASGNLGE